NHGQAVAWAARELGVPSTIFVPLEAPMAKVEACRNYGAKTVMTGSDFEDALTAALQHIEETGGTFIHPYEDQLVIAGQGTIGLELAEQVPDMGTRLIPVGGGGRPVGVAALLAGRAGGSGPAIPILSGGNIDATMLISVIRHGLTVAGRYLVVRTQLSDRPGELIKLLSLVAEERGNLISVVHHREGM